MDVASTINYSLMQFLSLELSISGLKQRNKVTEPPSGFSCLKRLPKCEATLYITNLYAQWTQSYKVQTLEIQVFTVELLRIINTSLPSVTRTAKIIFHHFCTAFVALMVSIVTEA
jgi:hypothetical protein